MASSHMMPPNYDIEVFVDRARDRKRTDPLADIAQRCYTVLRSCILGDPKFVFLG